MLNMRKLTLMLFKANEGHCIYCMSINLDEEIVLKINFKIKPKTTSIPNKLK